MIKETNIKQGYKKTAVGIIPEDWEVKRLEELSSHFKSGSGITSKDIEESGEYPVYGGNGLRGYTETFTHDGKYLLIGRQGALCGNIQRVKGKAYISEHAIAVQTNKLNDLEFLASKLEYYNLNRLSESSAQPGLAVNKLVRLKLPIPPLPEQKAIADCLSTWDKAIEKQTQLIEAKKEFKKGLMQGFFNGQWTMNNGQLVKAKEGEDFTEDWEEVKLENIAKFRRGKGLSKDKLIDFGKNKCILYGELYTTYNEVIEKVISKTNASTEKMILSKKLDVLIPSSTTTSGLDLITASCVLESGILLGGDLNVLTLDSDKLNPIYFSYLFTNGLKKEVLGFTQGITIIHLYNEGLKQVKFSIPNINIQNKIVNIVLNAKTWTLFSN